MNKELIEILTNIRIWAFKDTGECRGDILLDYGCEDVACSSCPLFQSRHTSNYSNIIVKVIPHE